MRYSKYIPIVVFILVYILFDTSIGYSHSSPLYTHFTYILQHASILHLALNSIAFISLHISLSQLIRQQIFLPIATLCAVSASLFAVYDTPTVGASALIYAMMGIYIGITLLYKNIKIANTKKYLRFICVVALALTLSLFRANSNFLIHIYSLSFGFIGSFFIALRDNQK